MQTLFRRSIVALIVAAAFPAANVGAADETTSTWLDSYTTRLEALALLQSLNADLLSHDSATLTLDRWCASHHLGDPPTITAERVHDADKPATAAQRELLHVSASEPLAYRHVRLHCGLHVLSEADNWYVPARLTPDMNQALEHSDIAFGRAIEALHFQRRTLSAELLWAPLPEGWEMTGPTAEHDNKLVMPHLVLQHTAVLSLPDGTPISALTESYTSEVLAFPEPR
jgi:chorismate-pyruvate lyase